MAQERKEVRIEEVDGGYIVDLDHVWRDRVKGEEKPEDRRFISASLPEILERVQKHLTSSD